MRYTRWLVVPLLIAGALQAHPALAQATGGEAALSQRAGEVTGRFVASPGRLEAMFAPEMLQAVPAAQLAGIFADMYARYGACEGFERLAPEKPGQGRFTLRFAKGYEVECKLYVEPQAPHRVTGLWFGAAAPTIADWAGLSRAFSALGGKAAFAVARLEPSGPIPLASHDADRPLGVGSAFKLFLLATLIEDIEAGRRRWSDVVALDAAARSLPSGALHTWPVGSPLTLHTLATLMIANSDNTATDQLLQTLGRERVEARLSAFGVRESARNVPLLSTLELFKLKWGNAPAATRAYLAGDTAARRAVLAGAIAKMPASAVKPGSGTPTRIDELEWFASANDLIRTIDWLRRHSRAGRGAEARGVLSVNRGLSFDAHAWPYVGFKGGSEPGVLNMTYLLRDRTGRWYALAATWNDPAAPLDEARFFGLVQRAVHLLAAPTF